jgi:hypothetical protein
MKRVVRKKNFKIASHLQSVGAGVLLMVESVKKEIDNKILKHVQPLWIVGFGVLLVAGFLLFKQSQHPMKIKPITIGGGKMSSYTDRWKDQKGWWGGYWWGSDTFFWKGREWGLGKSSYPWYWEHDKVARELNLAELARNGHWLQVESNILKKISDLEQEIQATDNKATKRKLERTIDRLEYYLFDAKNYQRTPIKY